jgi:hypothetical protein
MKKLLSILPTVFLMPLIAVAQFAPPAGQLGSTAFPADSSVFVGWATGCTVNRGFQDISNPTLGTTTVGDSSMALGKAGINGVVSLGDGGSATVTFERPITNGPGWDFAVFENSFSDTFLELAFVEVSSDGENYFRFPAISNTQDTLQIDGFGIIDATKINNFAGKYRAGFGTPFDLEELSNITQLNINAITHVKIIDVVGCIQAEYASYDINGKKINDPWPTPFSSGGFDLDGVGVIHQSPQSIADADISDQILIYPNPVSDFLIIENKNASTLDFILTSMSGQIMAHGQTSGKSERLNAQQIPSGICFIILQDNKIKITKKIIINH